jgi:hypothetical protein
MAPDEWAALEDKNEKKLEMSLIGGKHRNYTLLMKAWICYQVMFKIEPGLVMNNLTSSTVKQGFYSFMRLKYLAENSRSGPTEKYWTDKDKWNKFAEDKALNRGIVCDVRYEGWRIPFLASVYIFGCENPDTLPMAYRNIADLTTVRKEFGQEMLQAMCLVNIGLENFDLVVAGTSDKG